MPAGDVAVAKILIMANANVNSKNSGGETPLGEAAKRECSSIESLLWNMALDAENIKTIARACADCFYIDLPLLRKGCWPKRPNERKLQGPKPATTTR